jgi:hypothetical protein
MTPAVLDNSSATNCLLGFGPGPTDAWAGLLRLQRKARLLEAFNRQDPLDRELLALRHLELPSNAEPAFVLTLPEAVPSRRYLEALKPPEQAFPSLSGGHGESAP